MSAKDHMGNEYHSLQELCREYGISVKTYRKRIANGWSLERTLKVPLRTGYRTPEEERTDHKGNVYPNVSAMCRAYGIRVFTYRHRLEIGWNKEDALTKPSKKADPIPEQARTDYKGNVYKSINAMCKAYGINKNTYWSRISSGMEKEEALKLKVNKNHKIQGI